MKARDDEEELADDEDKKKSPNSVVHEVVNKRWEVCVKTSSLSFIHQIRFSYLYIRHLLNRDSNNKKKQQQVFKVLYL